MTVCLFHALVANVCFQRVDIGFVISAVFNVGEELSSEVERKCQRRIMGAEPGASHCCNIYNDISMK